MSSSNSDPARLYPPSVLPTETLAVLFDPARTAFPWHRLPPPPTSASSAPVPIISAGDSPGMGSGVPSIAPVPAQASRPPMQYMSGNVPALSLEHTKRIFDHVRTRDAATVEPQARSTGVWERFGMATSSLLGSAEPRTVTLSWLTQHRVTLRNLIKDCNIAVTDLYQAHIARSIDDLVALGFDMPLLTVNRTCLNVQQVAMCFRLNYAAALAHPKLRTFGLLELVRADPKFTVDELLTLGVTADALLNDENDVLDTSTEPKMLSFAGLTPAEWVMLGLTKEQLLALKVTPRVARSMGKAWEPNLVAAAWHLDAAWLKS